MTVIIHQITAVLDMPEDYLGEAQRGNEIITASTGNAYVTVPPATITAASNAVAVLQNATTPAERKAAQRPLRIALQAIMSFFQAAGDADPANAEVIIESGAFKVKKISLAEKHIFQVSNGVASGTIDLETEGSGPYTCHDWRYSPDGITFTRMAPTMSAHTQMVGLTPGQLAYFTNEVVTKDGGQGVSQILQILVK
jgi:hypothetical protein